jgi:glycerol-3-phosphate dehydrogenase
MAEDVMRKCVDHQLIISSHATRTEHMKLVGAENLDLPLVSICEPEGLHSYGSEQHWVESLPGHDSWLCEGFNEAMVRFSARYEYAVTVEDVLARRSRLLFLDAKLAAKVASRVGAILFEETNIDPKLNEFLALARNYSLI